MTLPPYEPSAEQPRPKMLDFYCCEGGAARGYDLAGFDVYGVDLFKTIKGGFSRKRYPYPAWQGSALSALQGLLSGDDLLFDRAGPDGRAAISLGDFAALHASPPCQHASAGTRAMRAHGDDRHQALIEPTRELLIQTGLPYIIENVKGAALIDPVTLCWSMFDSPETPWIKNEDGVPLRMERHRLFETSWPLSAPTSCYHPENVQVAGSYGAAQRTIVGAKKRGGGYVPAREIQQRLLGIDWMTERGMHQALPPSYTQHVGLALLAYVKQEVAA